MATRLSTQSRLRACSIATSYTVPVTPALGMVTVRSSIWPITRVSVEALLEPAHVEQAGGVHLPAVDVGHPGHGDEDPAASEDLGHHPQHPRLADLGAHRHDRIPDLSDLVALGSKIGSPTRRAA